MWPFLTFCFANIVKELLYQIRTVWCVVSKLLNINSIEKAVRKAFEIAYT